MRVLSVVKCQQGKVERQDGRRDVVTYYTFEDQVGTSLKGQCDVCGSHSWLEGGKQLQAETRRSTFILA